MSAYETAILVLAVLGGLAAALAWPAVATYLLWIVRPKSHPRRGEER